MCAHRLLFWATLWSPCAAHSLCQPTHLPARLACPAPAPPLPLLQCLFSTETFAMGLNMPARTCVFTALQKWDGEANRWMGSGEYIQMSGRAGGRASSLKGLLIVKLRLWLSVWLS